MERAFRLQGLLNLRHLQEEQAAGRLAAANAELHRSEETLLASRQRLAKCEINNEGGNSSLAVSAALRAATRLQIAENEVKRGYNQQVVAARQAEWSAVRRQAASLEKLEDHHIRLVAADELHKEQVVLDELASQRGASRTTDGTVGAANRRRPKPSATNAADRVKTNDLR